jgi:uncharacterized protein
LSKKLFTGTTSPMAGTLVDTSVWLAAAFARHAAHQVAKDALRRSTPVAPALFCRATQQSVLRLLSTPGIPRTYGDDPLSNTSAWAALDTLGSLPHVRFSDEPPGLVPHWRVFSALKTSSPKVWMDAYLAAFAVAGGLQLVTLDSDFRSFTAHGLNLTLLKAS